MSNRGLFNEWGIGLDASDFACALAALGVGQAKYGNLLPAATEYAENDLTDAFAPTGDPVGWTIHTFPEELAETYLHPDSARRMAEAWKGAITRTRDQFGWQWHLRIQVESNPYVETLMPWVLQQLSQPEVGADSVVLWDGDLGPMVPWHWPIRIGFLNNPKSQHFNNLLFSRGGVDLVSRFPMPEQGESCDLLFLPTTLRQGVLDVLERPEPLRASCIVVLGGMDDSWPQSHLQKALLLETLEAAGIYIADIPIELQSSDWFDEFVTQLSHNETLDICFHRATQRAAEIVGFSQLPYLFYGTEWLVLASRLSAQASIMSGRLADLENYRQRIEILPDAEAILGFDFGFLGKTLSEKLSERIQQFGFDAESREATGLAMLSGSIDRSEQEWARTNKKPRWIQAQVFELEPTGPSLVRRALRADSPYAVDVRIGPEDIDWLMPPETEVFPDWELEPEARGHILSVVFAEPLHAPEAQVKIIYLPPVGASAPCRFHFQPKSEPTDFEARIMVLHNNRILQTALLRAEVVASLEEIKDSWEIKLVIESVLRPNLADLENRRQFDTALMINKNQDGEPRMIEASGDRARLCSLKGLEQVSDQIRYKLEEIALNPEDFPRDLFAEATEKLLRYLAIQGSHLYKGLVIDQMQNSKLSRTDQKPLRLQIVSAMPESFLPLEFVYAKPAPGRDAKLCSKALTALQNGSCQDCVMDHQVPNPLICPIGFWGLYHVIERHVNIPADNQHTLEFDLRSYPFTGRDTLNPLDSAVYAASNRVDKHKKGQIQSLLKVLEVTLDNRVAFVKDWHGWIQGVEALNPGLLVLLPHTFQDLEYDDNGMEIDEAEQLFNTYFTVNHVHALESEKRPLVLLFGCETMAPEIPFQSFIAEFRRNGASIVVGTASSVLGRHAGTVAETAIKILNEMLGAGLSTFGEVMLTLRRRAMAEGLPMVLTLFAYGDADWKLSAGD